MEVRKYLSLPVSEISQVYQARRVFTGAAAEIGFNETDMGRISIIVTELGGNLIKHTPKGGELLLQLLSSGQLRSVEIVSADRGEGMKNVAECLTDGFSTSGSMGTGLGSVKRLSDFFDVFSAVGKGTVVLSRLYSVKNQQPAATHRGFELGGLSLPMPGQEACGDRWAWKPKGNNVLLMIADGLGHGFEASQASVEAARIFEQEDTNTLAGMMAKMNDGLKKSRGAALALAEIDPVGHEVSFCGIGNIAGIVMKDGLVKRMVSNNGIVGFELKKLQTFRYPWEENSLLVMHSDGLSIRWNFDSYPGLSAKSSSLISCSLYNFHSRRTDDSTVVTLKRGAKIL